MRAFAGGDGDLLKRRVLNPVRLLVVGSLLLLACSFFSPGGSTPAVTPNPTPTDDVAGTATQAALSSGVGLPSATVQATWTLAAPTSSEGAQSTATPTRAAAKTSPTNFPTAGIQRTAPPAGPDFLTTVASTKRQMEVFGGIMDIAANGGGSVDCHEVVKVHDAVVNALSFNVASQLAGAYQLYRSGVDNFAAKTRDMDQNCQTFLAGGNSGGIPFQQWGPARQGVNESVDLLRQAIIAAGGTP
jgi:hypothetical protein